MSTYAILASTGRKSTSQFYYTFRDRRERDLAVERIRREAGVVVHSDEDAAWTFIKSARSKHPVHCLEIEPNSLVSVVHPNHALGADLIWQHHNQRLWSEACGQAICIFYGTQAEVISRLSAKGFDVQVQNLPADKRVVEVVLGRKHAALFSCPEAALLMTGGRESFTQAHFPAKNLVACCELVDLCWLRMKFPRSGWKFVEYPDLKAALDGRWVHAAQEPWMMEGMSATAVRLEWRGLLLSLLHCCCRLKTDQENAVLPAQN